MNIRTHCPRTCKAKPCRILVAMKEPAARECKDADHAVESGGCHLVCRVSVSAQSPMLSLFQTPLGETVMVTRPALAVTQCLHVRARACIYLHVCLMAVRMCVCVCARARARGHSVRAIGE